MVEDQIPFLLLSGGRYLTEIIEGNPVYFPEILRMEKHAFADLCSHFKSMGLLESSHYICFQKKMAMVLMTLSHNTRNHVVKWSSITRLPDNTLISMKLTGDAEILEGDNCGAFV